MPAPHTPAGCAPMGRFAAGAGTCMVSSGSATGVFVTAPAPSTERWPGRASPPAPTTPAPSAPTGRFGAGEATSPAELGVGDLEPRLTPTQVGQATNWARVATGDFVTCAIRTNGTLWCW